MHSMFTLCSQQPWQRLRIIASIPCSLCAHSLWQGLRIILLLTWDYGCQIYPDCVTIQRSNRADVQHYITTIGSSGKSVQLPDHRYYWWCHPAVEILFSSQHGTQQCAWFSSVSFMRNRSSFKKFSCGDTPACVVCYWTVLLIPAVAGGALRGDMLARCPGLPVYLALEGDRLICCSWRSACLEVVIHMWGKWSQSAAVIKKGWDIIGGKGGLWDFSIKLGMEVCVLGLLL